MVLRPRWVLFSSTCTLVSKSSNGSFAFIRNFRVAGRFSVPTSSHLCGCRRLAPDDLYSRSVNTRLLHEATHEAAIWWLVDMTSFLVGSPFYPRSELGFTAR